jgi:hypothetical protein
MDQQEIDINNKLINDFMHDVKSVAFAGNSVLQVHNCWDCIMKIVEEITKIGFRPEMVSYHDVRYQGNPLTYAFRIDKYAKIVSFSESTNMKQAIYGSIIKFITWYNLNKQNNI